MPKRKPTQTNYFGEYGRTVEIYERRKAVIRENIRLSRGPVMALELGRKDGLAVEVERVLVACLNAYIVKIWHA